MTVFRDYPVETNTRACAMVKFQFFFFGGPWNKGIIIYVYVAYTGACTDCFFGFSTSIQRFTPFLVKSNLIIVLFFFLNFLLSLTLRRYIYLIFFN